MGGDELPRLGEGWNDPHEIIKEILETGEELPEWAEDGTEVVNYIESEWPVTEDDLKRLEAASKRDDWGYCSMCGSEYKMRSWVDESEAQHKPDAETRYTGTFSVYCQNQECTEAGEHFSFTETWYE